MSANDFAKIVTEMLMAEKDNFKEWLQNEDWQTIEDEIYEYVSQAE